MNGRHKKLQQKRERNEKIHREEIIENSISHSTGKKNLVEEDFT